ncbi:MAG: hypothetical protein WAS01_08235, partial [Nostocoides sp.]
PEAAEVVDLDAPDAGPDLDAADFAVVDLDAADGASVEDVAVSPVAAGALAVAAYGAGSALPTDDGSGPQGWEVKGNEDSMLYHTPESQHYERTVAEVWFIDEATAVAAGFSPWNWKQRAKAAQTAKAGQTAQSAPSHAVDAVAAPEEALVGPVAGDMGAVDERAADRGAIAAEVGADAEAASAKADPSTPSPALSADELDEAAALVDLSSTVPSPAVPSPAVDAPSILDAPPIRDAPDASAAPAMLAGLEVVPDQSDQPELSRPASTRITDAASEPEAFVEAAYGKGSVLPASDGSGPSGWEVKGNEDSMLFHTPSSPNYRRTRAEVWFADEVSAQAAGFTRWDHKAPAVAPPALMDVPPGPYGPGSAAPGPRGKGPEGWTIKGNQDSMLFHTPESPWFKRTKAEVWFADEASAERAGFTRWDRNS